MDNPSRPFISSYTVWGKEHIDKASLDQMSVAISLPVVVGGALMPDAHVGYGLPIGGVLATRDAIIPYAVGVDIACRMRLSIFSISPHVLGQHTSQFTNALIQQTRFGAGAEWGKGERSEHPVLDDPDWSITAQIKSLHDTAYAQLGTSGSGNHFVEWGALSLSTDQPELGLVAGEYLALLSHSGSRGFGYQIANYYSKLAMNAHPELDAHIRHLAWFTLDSELGATYWLAMQLAGRYAAANHEIIHGRVASAVGLKPVAVVENHHNFAWREQMPHPNDPSQSLNVIIHRKGATPAHKGVMGIIPGSMGDKGFIVRGKGIPSALYSASHGAGRLMSRRQASQTITKTERDKFLRQIGVTLIGGDLDEAPQAYKPIEAIMSAQSDLVDIVAVFTPRIVRMDESTKRGKQRR